jgi:hypothetical protein
MRFSDQQKMLIIEMTRYRMGQLRRGASTYTANRSHDNEDVLAELKELNSILRMIMEDTENL